MWKMGRISLCNMEHIDMQLFLSSSPTVTSMCFDAFGETPKCNSSFIRYLYIYIYIYIYVCVCVCVCVEKLCQKMATFEETDFSK